MFLSEDAATSHLMADRTPDICPQNMAHKVLPEALADSLAASGPQFLVELRALADRHSLAMWAARYLAAEVYGVQSPNTLAAKSKDLHSFIVWFLELNGHADIAGWYPRDTKVYLDHLEQHGRKPRSVNRAFATLRRFARWAHDQEDSPFAQGLPTRGIKELVVDLPQPKKLTGSEVHALFKAADALVDTETRKNARPRRNRAMLALLHHSGLRVSEMCALRLDQYQGKYLHTIKRKGNNRTDAMYLAADCRRAIDDYLENVRLKKDDPQSQHAPLFLSTRGGLGVNRRRVATVLDHIAEEACKHREGQLDIHPHRLRHTFGWNIMQKTKSESATARALGHATKGKYTGWYIGLTQDEQEALLDSISSGNDDA
jgi:integrase/recombinase XerC